MVQNITEYCKTLAEFRSNTGKEDQEDKIIDNGFMLLIEQTTRKNFLIDIYYSGYREAFKLKKEEIFILFKGNIFQKCSICCQKLF